MPARKTVRRRYADPPVIEAICEFQFQSAKPPDVTIHGLIYDRIKDRFPIKKQALGFQLLMEFKPAQKAFQHDVTPLEPRSQFYSNDQKSLLQVGPNFLAANKLKPYHSWEEFKDIIVEGFGLYDEIAQPEGFSRIGLRYVNKINFDAETINMEDYFRVYPTLPPELPQVHEAFLARLEIPYAEGRDRLLLTLLSGEPDKPHLSAVILDLDYVLTAPGTVPKGGLDDWLENAHSVVELAFEACVTDKSRSMFGLVT